MTDKLELKSSHEIVYTIYVADVESIFYCKPTDPDILTVLMKDGKRLYCDEVCPVREEPVSKDFEMALAEMIDKAQKNVIEPLVVAAQWKDELIELAKSEEPVSEDEAEKQFKVGDVVMYVSRHPAYSGLYLLGNPNDLSIGYSNADEPYNIALKNCTVASEDERRQFMRELELNGYKWNESTMRIEKNDVVSDDLEKAANDYSIYDAKIEAFKDGAQWQKEHLWKDAQGNDLPEIDREVIAIIQDWDYAGIYKIVFAHRPNPEGWDGKSLSTGEISHYTPKTYDKGGWNMSDVVYWLDIELPFKDE